MNSGLSWDEFRLVKSVAEARSLVGAAEALGLNHSTIFRRLGAVEDALGARLFERSRSGYQPTAAGEEMVALATGMAWLAHGSDMGGSLRNPASFCGVVGLRPSIGRVAHTPVAAIDRNLGVQGPMARNVEDLALLLDAMSGEHPADSLSLPVLPPSV